MDGTNSDPNVAPRDRVSIGFGGLSASSGDHIVHFYRTTDQRSEFLVPFLEEGLALGQKCVYLTPPGTSREETESQLRASGLDLEAAAASGQLVIGEGGTSPEELHAALNHALEDVPDRFSFLRWVGDMTWSVGKIASTEQLLEWESICNVIEPAPVVFLCQYDLSRFRGDVVIDALRTHPLALIGNAIHQNPYYQRPEVFLEDVRHRPATHLATVA